MHMKYLFKFVFLLLSTFAFLNCSAQESQSLVKNDLLNLSSFELAVSNSELSNEDYKKMYNTLLYYFDKVKADEALMIKATKDGWVQKAEAILANLKKNL
jgi:hypothetical protein